MNAATPGTCTGSGASLTLTFTDVCHPMPVRLYNTLTRRVEAFRPLHPPRVTLYSCGPTVRNYAHIGNFRTFLFVDILRRHLEYRGHEVFHIMNLTDVDDRTIQDAAASGRTLQEHTKPFVDAFFADAEFLRLRPAHGYPRATEHVPSMVSMIEILLDKGIAYRSEDGSVYFAVDRFPTYGRLSRLDRRELKVGARVSSDDYTKDDPRDFALWKRATEVDREVGAVWPAPFGEGRPGWHLECSAMSIAEIRQRFGVETLDIHTGGIDLIFPHHEDEIAQSEATTGQTFVRYWLHGAFLQAADGLKMAKRFGNFLTARDLLESGWDGAAFRHVTLSTHYRQPLTFSDDALAAAAAAVERIGDMDRRLRRTDHTTVSDAAVADAARVMEAEFGRAMDDDLNGPRALAAVHGFVHEANRGLDAGGTVPVAALEAWDRIMGVLDVVPAPREATRELGTWVEAQLQARQDARRAGRYAEADAIRDDLAARGVTVEDTPQGPRWKLG